MTKPPKNVQRSSPQPAKPRERPPLSREEVARWLVGNTGCLLRRIRGRTRAAGPGAAGPFAASLMDEQDILASVMRRVDAAAAGGSLRARSDAELWGFARTVVANVVQSRLRQGRRDIELFAVASPAEEADIVAVAEAEFERLAPLLAEKMRREDWDSVALRARGGSGQAIAAAAGVSKPAERKRWSRLLRLVRAAVSMNLRPAPPPPPARLGCSALRSSSGIGCMTCAA